MKSTDSNPPMLSARETWSRRDFLHLLGLSGLAYGGWTVAGEVLDAAPADGGDTAEETFHIVRPRDLVVLTVHLQNLKFFHSGTAMGFDLVDKSRGGYLTLKFGGQHIAEQAVWDRPIIDHAQDGAGIGKEPPPPLTYRLHQAEKPPVAGGKPLDYGDDEFLRLERLKDTKLMTQGIAGAWLSGGSQVVFRMPPRLASSPASPAFGFRSFDDLLRRCVREWDLVVPVAARAAGSQPVPGEPCTSIEFPTLLLLSPYENAHWQVRPASERDSRLELWSLDLETPDPLDQRIGVPRELRQRGHLVAVSHKDDTPHWPQPDLDHPANDFGKNAKYNSVERPKVSLAATTRLKLVEQMADDNGDIRADRFGLSALGATARLNYLPLVDTPGAPTNREGAKKMGTGGDTAEGFLSEWVQRTELGRDQFTKESFAGYWMPFGLSGEAVIITQRLLATPDEKAEDGDPLSRLSHSPSRQVNMEGEESNLTALLVARRFGRFKKRTFEVPPADSPDFTNLQNEIGRSLSGVVWIEILIEYTPALSNNGTNVDLLPPPPDGQSARLAALKAGDDVVVDFGDGTLMGREIFWPRVARRRPVGPAGKSQRQTEPFRVPLAFHHRDGSITHGDLPLLFVPDLYTGGALYHEALADLRRMPVDTKFALVEPMPPGAVTGANIAVDLELLAVGKPTFARDHLLAFVPPTYRELLQPRAGTPVTDGKPTAAAAEAVADALNVFMDGVPHHVARVVGDLRDTVKGAIASGPGGAGDTLQNWTADRLKTLGKDIERVQAWGQAHIAVVDSAAAASRISAILTLPASLSDHAFADVSDLLGRADTTAFPAQWQQIRQQADSFSTKAQSALKEVTGKLGQVEGLSGPSRTRIDDAAGGLVDSLHGFTTALAGVAGVAASGRKAALEAFRNGAWTTYAQAVRKFEQAWSIQLAGAWRRAEWDGPFARAVEIFSGPTEENPGVAMLLREIERGLLRGAPVQGVPPLRFAAAVPELCPKALCDAVAGVCKRLKNLVDADLQAWPVLLDALTRVFPEERTLRQRVIWLMQDAAHQTAAALAGDRARLFADLENLLVSVAAHRFDGREVVERFLLNALPGRELFDQAAREIRTAWQTTQANAAKKVQSLLSDDKVAGVQASLHALLVSVNPEQVRQKMLSMLAEGGGRPAVELAARLGSLRDTARTLLNKDGIERALDLAAGLVEGTRGKMEARVNAQPTVFVAKLSSARKDALVTTLTAFIEEHAAGRAASLRASISLHTLLADAVRFMEHAKSPTDATLVSQQQAVGSVLDALATNVRGLPSDMFVVAVNALKAARAKLGNTFQQRIDALLATGANLKGDNLLEEIVLALLVVSADAGFLAEAVALLCPGGDALAKLRGKLDETFPKLTADLQRLQGYVGEGQKLLDVLGSATHPVAAVQSLANSVRSQTNAIAVDLRQHVQASVADAEGRAYSLAKRAVVSLVAPELAKEFQDQSQKAVFEASEMFFTAVGKPPEALNQLTAFASFETLKVKVPGLDAHQDIALTREYLDHGLRQTKRAAAGIFAELTNSASSALQNTGVVQAAARVEVLSREIGAAAQSVRAQAASIESQARQAVDSLRQSAAGVIDEARKQITDAGARLNAEVKSLLPEALPNLFGVLPLDEILKAVGSPGDLPKMLSHHYPDRVEKTFAWRNALHPLSLAGLLKFEPVENDPDAVLRLDSRAVIYLPKPGQPLVPPSLSTRGQLGAFSVELNDLLKIYFHSVSFQSENGRFRCTPKLGGGPPDSDIIEFLGALKFVDEVRKQLSALLGGDNGLTFGIHDNAVWAGMKVALPTLGFGAVSIENLALSMGIGLPLESGPLMFRFALSERMAPFRVSVSGFAGGGFFALVLSTQSSACSLEAAIEFGGSLAFQVAIASGGLSVMAGIYYKRADNLTILDAYLRAVGFVRVLFIEVSVIFYLALGYRNEGGQSLLHGEASITVRVKIGFFSKSFSLSYEKTIAGSSDKTAFALPPGWDAPRMLVAGTNAMGTTAQTTPAGNVGKALPLTEAITPDQWAAYWQMFNLFL